MDYCMVMLRGMKDGATKNYNGHVSESNWLEYWESKNRTMGAPFSIITSGLILNIAGNQSMSDDVEVWLINEGTVMHSTIIWCPGI